MTLDELRASPAVKEHFGYCKLEILDFLNAHLLTKARSASGGESASMEVGEQRAIAVIYSILESLGGHAAERKKITISGNTLHRFSGDKKPDEVK